jgi:hypothetical protein
MGLLVKAADTRGNSHNKRILKALLRLEPEYLEHVEIKIPESTYRRMLLSGLYIENGSERRIVR